MMKAVAVFLLMLASFVSGAQAQEIMLREFSVTRMGAGARAQFRLDGNGQPFVQIKYETHKHARGLNYNKIDQVLPGAYVNNGEFIYVDDQNLAHSCGEVTDRGIQLNGACVLSVNRISRWFHDEETVQIFLILR